MKENAQLKKNLLVYFFGFFILSLQAQETRLDSILDVFNNRPEDILVMAHRSAHQSYPENSLAAMKESIRLGVDIIELDLRQTKDGEFVIIHDDSLGRTTTGAGKVADHTLAEIKKLNLLFDGKLTDERVPTFQEALDLTKNKIMIDVDFKIDDEGSAKRTFDIIAQNNAEDQILFFLYNFRYTPKVHQINKDIKIMPRAYSTCDVEDILKYDYIKIVHIDHDFYNDYLMKKMAYSGERILVKTMGTLDSLEIQQPGSGFSQVLKEKYVNVIQTDIPGELLDFLREKDLHR